MIGDYRPECDIPGVSGKVLDAATSDVPARQAVLTLSANSCPIQATIERQVQGFTLISRTPWEIQRAVIQIQKGIDSDRVALILMQHD
jgi:hypothetical protein